MQLRILPKVSRGNDQFSIKFKSKLNVSFAEGSRKYKLIECNGDSSVASYLNRFICFFFVVVLAACYEHY